MSTPTQGGPGDDLPPYRSGGPPGWVPPPAYGPTGQPVPPPGRYDGPYQDPYDPAPPYDPAQQHDPAPYDPRFDPSGRQYPSGEPAYGEPSDRSRDPQRYDQLEQPSRAPEQPGAAKGPRPAVIAAGMVAVALIGTVGGWTLAGGRNTPQAVAPISQDSTPPTAPGSAPPSGKATPSTSPPASVPVSGAAQADPAAAKAELKAGGVATAGTPQVAWTWTDTNGRNVLVLSKQVTKREGDVVREATLFVHHAAGRDGKYERLRVLTQPGVKDCDVDYGLDFVPGSVVIGDADSDGYGEATVGWWFSCRGDPGPYSIRLALVSKGERWILRGDGQRASDPALPNGITIPPATFKPSEPAAAWPKGSYDPTVILFKKLFK